MAHFNDALTALQHGKRVRREEWDEGTRLFIDANGELMQQATGATYPYQLAGHEIMAEDWRTF